MENHPTFYKKKIIQKYHHRKVWDIMLLLYILSMVILAPPPGMIGLKKKAGQIWVEHHFHLDKSAWTLVSQHLVFDCMSHVLGA